MHCCMEQNDGKIASVLAHTGWEIFYDMKGLATLGRLVLLSRLTKVGAAVLDGNIKEIHKFLFSVCETFAIDWSNGS